VNKAFHLIVDTGVIAGTFLMVLGFRPSPAEDHHGAVPAAAAENQTPGEKRVKITPQRDGNVTRVLVENRELCEVTVTFDFGLTNLESTVGFPHTTTFPPGQVTEAFVLSPQNTNESWNYSFTCQYKLGSAVAQHDDSYVYALPYVPGESFRVTPGYDGKFSHKGSNRYAIDWAMPEGTPVCAARGGLVVKVKDYSDRSGPSIAFDRFNNFIVIRHEDGTLGQYAHLLKDSAAVTEGDIVQAGDIIARSGNTGFSSGPHLHFSVFKARTGKERESIPIRFQTAKSAGTTLEALRRYTAVAPEVPAKSTATGT